MLFKEHEKMPALCEGMKVLVPGWDSCGYMPCLGLVVTQTVTKWGIIAMLATNWG